jgi:PmbA protein
VTQVPAANQFSYTRDALNEIVADCLKLAREKGASDAEAEVSEGNGHTVTVRLAEVETIEYHRDKGLSVTVFFGKRRGHASTSDLSLQAISDTVVAACSIAKQTAQDDYAGLADPALLARSPTADLELYHPWGITVEQSIELARQAESAALGVDKRVKNSEGGQVSTQDSHFIYGNSLGFMGGYPSSRQAVSCSVIAGADDAMQRDDWYTTARDAGDMEAASHVGKLAGERAVRRLGARKLKTMEAPVLFETTLASGLISHLVSALSGNSLYRKSSFLLDSIGKPIFPTFFQITERPHVKKGLASTPFDAEGVATRDRGVVNQGVVEGYFLGSYSARKLGMRSTANSGGNHNLIIRDTGQDFAKLLKDMKRGLLVTELLGHGVNIVTGDYSRGAAGYWVEDGEIQYPVEEITIAGNLKDMYKRIAAVGNDALVRGSKTCGSILIERMTIAGN